MPRMFVGFSIDPVVISALDKVRGDIPRSRAVERMICEQLGVNSPSELAGHSSGE